jgi:hypothetical protein
VLERTASEGAIALLAAQGMSSLEGCKSRELDGEVRRLSAALAEHELKLSRGGRRCAPRARRASG